MSDITAGMGAAAYDATTDSPTRRSFIAFPTNSRRELTPWTRREVIKKHRALEANCAFLTRIKSKFARQAIGTGIHFRFETEDQAFNDAARRDVETWWNNKDAYSIDGSVDGWESKRLAAETIILDGEYNAVMVKGESGWPMIQPLDVFEIETPPLKQGESPAMWDDGVKVNEFERPLAYSVRSLPKTGNEAFRLIAKQDVIHLFKRRRARGHRGMPWGYSGLNQGIDALDLNALVTGTAKLHSALAVAVKGTGKRGKKGAFNKIETGNATDPTNTQPLEKVFGSMVNYLGEHGELQLLTSNHPGQNVLEFIKLLFQQMCLGYDLPFSVMWSMTEGGGTSVRYDAEDAQSAFDQLGDLVTWQFVRREIIWKVATSIKSGRIAQPKDPFWFDKILFRGPRKITVDVGRMANAFKTLTRNCGMSIPRFLEEQGLDADAEMSDQIRFLARTKAKCEAEGVDFNMLYEPTPGVINQLNMQPQE
jgi:capsid protein